MGAASRWWLHGSLASLDSSLDGALCCLQGRADDIIPRLARDTGATGVYVNRCVEPWRRTRDRAVRAQLEQDGRELNSYPGSTLFDPARIAKADGTPYRVFTPFYRKGCREGAESPREPLPRPRTLRICEHRDGLSISDLGLMPDIGWYAGMEETWEIGEKPAADRLDKFLDGGLHGYREGRNRPDLDHVSRLSPHLHFGEISPNQIWHSVLPLTEDARLSRDVDAFMSELGWREFSCYLLWHWPSLPEDNLQKKFDRFPWHSDAGLLGRWQKGLTGYPIVDAGMRELWHTGYMHNRVRMIAGSFLVKNLLTDWREGEAWFWDTLVDADLASNSAGWQWIAGSGADAAPYFRIFNPVTQGRKFDPDGAYVRRWLPELDALDDRYLHCPWEAPASARSNLGYPEPVVDLKVSRERALAAFRSISGRGQPGSSSRS
jgi:deoxyribodipyrimidine photo-lyase